MEELDQIYEVLSEYKDALNYLVEKVDTLGQENETLRNQVGDLENTLFRDILEPAQKAMDEADTNERFNQFSDKYGEQLNPLAEQVNNIEGEGSDFLRAAFDGYDQMEVPEGEEKPTDDEYVETLVEKTTEKINAIKSALGVDNVEIKVDEDGETEVKADGEDVTEEVTDEMENPDNVEVEEKVKEEVAPGEEIELKEEEPADEDNPEDVAELEKQLQDELKNYK